MKRADGMSIAQALAMTVAEIPVFLYSTFGQVMSPSTRSNDTMSGISSLAPSKHSSSSHSLASVRAPVSPNHTANPSTPWEAEVVAEEPGSAEDANAENLYIMGMELFEEALQKWELALNIRHRTHASSSSNSLALQGAAAAAPPCLEIPTVDNHNKGFAEKLETLLHRAYHLQEDFGSSIPPDSLLADFESEGTLILPSYREGSRRRVRGDDDATTITSDDSFFSAAELFDAMSLEDVHQPLKQAALYEEAMGLVREDKVIFRSLRTELLECYGDQDFLAKLHCVRQAFQVLLSDGTQRTFFMETGKQMIAGLMVKANKSPKAFLESYQDMLLYTQREDTWAITKMELEGRGVASMNFFDIVLDFILMDAFEDLEDPPSSVVAVLRNRWLSDSFKETVPDGFISHFYSISEHVSPVLAFGFLGPGSSSGKSAPSLRGTSIRNKFKQQIVQYLKDMFDDDKVRFTSAPCLAQDILSLSHRRRDILLGYLGIDGLQELNGALPPARDMAHSSPGS
ncbi:hypothetical protein CRUP_002913 [Coryphaenoides rupestris]|nr:hypothetical protein CRUP_002913 [Coryphaenoides rupestris]